MSADLLIQLLTGLIQTMTPQQWDTIAAVLTDAAPPDRQSFAAQHPALGELVRVVEKGMAGAAERAAGAHMADWVRRNADTVAQTGGADG